MSTLIKICGITSVEDAQLAISAGADYLGLIFVESSPRQVSLEAAQAISDTVKGKGQVVGVFKDSTPADIQHVLDQVRLDAVQLHGQERMEDYSHLPVPLIRALSLSLESPLTDSLQALRGSAQYLLLDRPKGHDAPDWLPWALDTLAPLPNRPPLFLAGGLTAETIPAAISRLQPTGVDVASGVEARPGVKDPQKLLAFCRAVQACDNALEQQRKATQ